MNEGWQTTKSTRCFIEGCAHSKEAPAAEVRITYAVWQVLVQLTRDVEDEWQAFLSGTDENGVVTCDGYWIPKQEVSGASVSNLDIVDQDVVASRRLVASIHSHANMEVFHSQTDIESTCKSAWIKHHITMNNKLRIVGKSQLVLPCGKIGFIDTKVVVIGAPTSTAIEGFENITKSAIYKHGWRSEYYDSAAYDMDAYAPIKRDTVNEYTRKSKTRTSTGRGLSYV